jgi:energy-coupling factor transporter ATP-binding protein EcfA2
VVEFLGMRIKSLKLKDHPVLGDLELDFTIGDRVADNIIIAGENGCGKTTLLNVINDFFRSLTSGKFTNDDEYHTKLSQLNDEPPVTNSYIAEIELCDFWTNSHHVQLLEPEQVILDSSLSEDEQNIRMALESAKIRIENSKLVFNERTLDDNLVADLGIRSILRELKTFFIKSDFDLKTKPIEYPDFDLKTEPVEYIASPNQMNNYVKPSEAQALKKLFIDLVQIVQEGIELGITQVSDRWSIDPEEALGENYKSILDNFKEAFSLMELDGEFKEIRQDYSSWDVIFKPKHSQDTEILIENLSSGEKQIVFKGIHFLHEIERHRDINYQTLTCFIDEPEISMHPRWQKKIMAFYKRLASNSNGEQESQIFVATHSPFIIHEANSQTDKVIVLQKDQEGKIIVDKNPLFESCDGEKLVEAAFYIDNFRKSTKPLVIIEGKTDKKILETAWEKLYPNTDMPFEILEAGTHPNAKERNGGANHITSLLSYSLRFNENYIIGLFDNDYEGNTEMSKLKKNNFELIETSNLAYCKYPDKDVFGLLLPCPDHRKDYVYGKVGAKTQKQLVIEHYFNDTILKKHQLKGEAFNQNVFKINDGSKTKFATETIQTLPPEDFASFKILFDALERLLKLNHEQQIRELA